MLLILLPAISWFVAKNKYYDEGVKYGVDFYHQMCYNNSGGFVWDEEGRVVTCSGLGKIPKEEFQQKIKPLDKAVKM